jgi:anaerobic selenocysteine-containing dehydrogenase
MGITHHAHGVQNVQAIANLALMRGMAGRPGAGLLPIRGHSNVQGIGSVGVTPKLKDAIFERLQTHFGVTLPTTPGLDTMGCMEAANRGELKFGLCLGGNLYGSNPDATFAQSALENLDMLVYLSTTLNTGHAHGLARETIILPVLARDEEPQATTQESMFNLVRLSDGGPRRHPGPKSEVEVIATIAHNAATGEAPSIMRALAAGDRNGSAGLQSIDWKSMRNTGRIRESIAAIIPGFDQIKEMDRTKEEFQVAGRTIHERHFPTRDGRAVLHTHALPDLYGDAAGELRLMTIRSEGQFNTVVYEDYDLYRGVADRRVILMHPDDIAARGFEKSEQVTIHGPAGSMAGVRIHPFPQIKPGNAAMYYPECNVIVSRHLDPDSKTPAFKCVVIKLESTVVGVS